VQEQQAHVALFKPGASLSSIVDASTSWASRRPTSSRSWKR
jgi:hypothetical protein